MNRTGIEYLDYAWNPIVGCSGEDCAVRDRCWARRQARRQVHRCPECGEFVPHLHLERIHQPRRLHTPSLIGTCFMADIFDRDVNPVWREFVWNEIALTPWHQYLVLTKHPERASILPLDNLILGVSVNAKRDLWRINALRGYAGRKAVSFEPLLEDMGELDLTGIECVIIGAQTCPDVQPRRDWVDRITKCARESGARVVFKDNLKEVPTE